MNTLKFLIVVVSIALLSTESVYHQVVNAQQEGDITDQRDVRQFLELGEEKYREECNKDISDNEIFDDTMNDLLDYMPDNVREDMCEDKISEIKNQTLGSILGDEINTRDGDTYIGEDTSNNSTFDGTSNSSTFEDYQNKYCPPLSLVLCEGPELE